MARSELSWTGRRVFITGSTGFVGSWLTTALLQLGAEVVGFADNTDARAKEREQWLGELGATCVTGDVRNLEELLDALGPEPVDALVHLAAQPLVGVGLDRPHETLEINVGGSLNVLEAARLRPPRVLVQVTSDKCYRNHGRDRPYREDDELGGGCPYSVSKAAAELLFETYADLYGATPRAASVRFGNVIGGGDFAASRLVPDCVAALAADRPIELRRPGAVRPWQHVLDVVRGMLLLIDALERGTVPPGDVLNFAPPGAGATARRLADALVAAKGGGRVRSVPVSGLVEDEVLRLDGGKAAAALDWQHRLDLDAAADWIVAWHRAVDTGATPAAATAGQVARFLGTATGAGAR